MKKRNSNTADATSQKANYRRDLGEMSDDLCSVTSFPCRNPYLELYNNAFLTVKSITGFVVLDKGPECSHQGWEAALNRHFVI